MQSTVDYEIFHKNQVEPLTFYVRNTLTGDLEDVSTTSYFNLIKIVDDTSMDSGNFINSGSTDIIRLAEGIYKYNVNTLTLPDEYIFSLRCSMQNEMLNQDIFLKSCSAKHYAYAAHLRNTIDKSRKSISDEIENMNEIQTRPSIKFNFGYETKHLIYYLERGVQMLNAISPYTWMTVDTFPFSQYGGILIDAATIAAMEAQGLFAIDTDFDYQLGGNALVIQHYDKISAFLSALLVRFKESATYWKQQYRAKGSVLVQYLPGGVRSSRLISALPGEFWSRFFASVQG